MILAHLPTTPETLWEQTPNRLNNRDRWQAYLGKLALDGVMGLLQENRQVRPSFPSASTLELSHLTEAVAIEVSNLRLVLIQSETLDHAELRVPQEWVELPSLVGDYYLGIQVEPDDATVTIWGYSSHQLLKTQGQLNLGDRTYSLPQEALISDLNVLWLTQTFCPETARAAVTAPAPIAPAQAQNLIDRLATAPNPRLEIPTALWGALIENGGWRKELAQARQGIARRTSVLEWLQQGLDNLTWQKQTLSLGGARSIAGDCLVRSLTINDQAYNLRIFQVETAWRFELRAETGVLPTGMELRLLTEDLQAFEGNSAIAQADIEAIYIDVTLEAGEGLVWEVSPTPEEYDREILWF
ncbi:MAG: DUF1822 family protein [Alkalinema sp. RU_4_3]|nr:DUF1822 family protein [Alkalinema sp. RU_4_3]